MFPFSRNIFHTELHPLRKPHRKKLNFWILVGLLKGVFFGLAAALQHNDPDPYLWMPAYLIPSLLSLRLAFKLATADKHTKDNPLWIERLIILQISYSFLLGLYTLILSGEDSLEDGGKMVFEEGKELIGLSILILWLGLISRNNFLRLPEKIGTFLGGVVAISPLFSWGVLSFYELC